MDARSTRRLANDLKALIKSKNLVYKDLATQLKVPLSTLSNWLAGESLIQLGYFQKLLGLLDVDESDWMPRWEAVKADRVRTKGQPSSREADFARTVAEALGLPDDLPSGSIVKVTVEIELP